MTTTTTSADRRPSGRSTPRSGARPKAKPDIVKTWVFDSVGDRKYALQIQKAGNGNPFLKLVEGVPQGDGTFRKFNIAIWSEDFERFFAQVDEVRAYIREHDIRTPDGHKYVPVAQRKKGRKRKTPGG